MKRTALNIMTALMLTLLPAITLAGTAHAACGTNSTAKSQVLDGLGQVNKNCDSNGVMNAISAAVQILSIVVGIAAVIMVISAGLKYITSGGDAQKVANAKTTLIYALVGLVVVALAQFLVHFVINNAIQAVPK